MVKVRSFSGPPKPSQSKRKATESSETGGQEARGESHSIVGRPSVSEQPSAPPVVSEPSAALAMVAPPSGSLVIVEEEEDDDRPLKRRKTALVANRATAPLGRSKGKERAGSSVAPSSKGKGKKQVGNADKWEPAISLDKTASIGDIDVSLHIAERIIPPTDGERFDSLNVEDLVSRAVRNFVREVAFTFAMHQRIKLLNQEVHSLLEQVESLKTELSEVKEGGDFSRAQLSSLEEEKKLWEEERNVLGAQLASGEEERTALKARLISEEIERVEAMAARNKLSEECAVLQGKLESESELKAKFLEDCHAAVSGQSRAEDELRRVRASIKGHRIEAILRWQKRFLQEECLEYSCDLALMILQNCYNAHVPEGSDGPSFEAFAEPLLPTALGLSLEEVKKRAQEDRSVPVEELDFSSAEEDESSAPAPLDPAPEASPRQSQSGDF